MGFLDWLGRILGYEEPPGDERGGEETITSPPRSSTPWIIPRPRRSKIQVVVPRKLEDAKKAADLLINRAAIVLNLQHVDSATAQRIVDILSGVSYALDGACFEVGQRIFLFVPPHMPAGGDEETLKAELFPKVQEASAENRREISAR